MALTELDKNLLLRCLGRKEGAWEDFVDRFTGLVIHVTSSTAAARQVRLSPEDLEDLAADVFMEIVKHDFGVLRHFRGQSSLATYLTVIARRVVVAALIRRSRQSGTNAGIATHTASTDPEPSQAVENREQVQRVLQTLDPPSDEAMRLHYLEGMSYEEISRRLGIPLNTLGSLLSRARRQVADRLNWA